MYQLLLTRRYLFSKIMPLLAAAAVLLCTAMVLIVWSVMGGFLNMLIGSGRTVTGDVIVTWPNAGFAHYDDLIQRLEKDPAVDAAAPMIESFAMLSLPDNRKENVIIRGVDGPSYARVTRYAETLWWKPLQAPLPKDKQRLDPRLGNTPEVWKRIYENGLSLSRPDKQTGNPEAAIVMGIEVSGFNTRYAEGYYYPRTREQLNADGTSKWLDMFLPLDGKVLVHMAPLDASGRVIQMESRSFPVANEFQSGVYEFDEKIVLMRLDACQQMLKLNAGKKLVKSAAPSNGPKVVKEGEPERFDDQPETLVDDPARVTHVIVKGKGEMTTGEDAQRLADRVRTVYAQFASDHKGQVPSRSDIRIFTWEDQNRTMINAVRKETGLLLVLFMIISLVAVFLILAIFWSMVAEKTKDIGVLRAVGAGSSGVAVWWVSYGLAIGLVGSALGLGLAYLVVTNINPIHEWLGQKLGLVIWDPHIYYFVTIPNHVEGSKALYVFIAGVLSSAIGALVPAVRAALMDPVRALRFE